MFTPSMGWQRLISTIILSPLLLVLIVASVPSILVVPFLSASRQKTALSMLDRYITCITALARLDTSSSPEKDDGQTTETADAGGDQDTKANAATPVQQVGSSDRTGVLVALWTGIVTCIGIFVAAAAAHGLLRIGGMLFGAIAAGITALWLIRIS